ncbi:MAG: Pycsar system effector family protein [Lewinella sp.]
MEQKERNLTSKQENISKKDKKKSASTKNKNSDDSTKSKNKSLSKALQSKTLDTFLKNQNRLLMSSISIADKKAATLIRLNTTLVSGLVVLESYLNTEINLNEYIIPFLIIGLSISLLFAILVSKPFSFILYRILNKVIKVNYPKLEENNFFLIDNIPFNEYEESMEKVMNSQELQIGNLTRFNYFMSRSISRKFILLEIAYSVFFLTLTGVLILYLLSKFI